MFRKPEDRRGVCADRGNQVENSCWNGLFVCAPPEALQADSSTPNAAPHMPPSKCARCDTPSFSNEPETSRQRKRRPQNRKETGTSKLSGEPETTRIPCAAERIENAKQMPLAPSKPDVTGKRTVATTPEMRPVTKIISSNRQLPAIASGQFHLPKRGARQSAGSLTHRSVPPVPEQCSPADCSWQRSDACPGAPRPR